MKKRKLLGSSQENWDYDSGTKAIYLKFYVYPCEKNTPDSGRHLVTIMEHGCINSFWESVSATTNPSLRAHRGILRNQNAKPVRRTYLNDANYFPLRQNYLKRIKRQFWKDTYWSTAKEWFYTNHVSLLIVLYGLLTIANLWLSNK